MTSWQLAWMSNHVLSHLSLFVWKFYSIFRLNYLLQGRTGYRSGRTQSRQVFQTSEEKSCGFSEECYRWRASVTTLWAGRATPTHLGGRSLLFPFWDTSTRALQFGCRQWRREGALCLLWFSFKLTLPIPWALLVFSSSPCSHLVWCLADGLATSISLCCIQR